LLVTHGDSLFHEAPWREPTRRRSRLLLRKRPDELDARELRTLEAILSANKRVHPDCGHHEHCIPNGAWGKFSTFMRQTWPPRRLVTLVSAWKQVPVEAVKLVRTYRPETRCVTVGHTHYPGVWHRQGYRIVNTGSFLPVLGRLAVDLVDGEVIVRKIARRGSRFHLGREVDRFSIR
jgi:hypothetical protein